ncbi:MAG: aminoacyl-tRNA hydrolase, partial [bacterium]
NLGFMAIDQLVNQVSASSFKTKFKAEICEAKIGRHKVILAKPQTFMNNSGEAVCDLTKFYKIKPANIIVIYDDVDLEVGVLRLRPGGGAGGHRGVQSIIDLLGQKDFIRVRIGIDKDPRMETADYVLGKISPAEKKILTETISLAACAVPAIIKDGLSRAMNRFNAA